MNKRNRIYVSALAVLLFAGCSNNDEAVIEPSPAQQGQITFAFSKTTGVTTYADPRIASEAESDLDVNGMKIYMVDNDSKKVETIFEGAEIVAGVSGTNATATISLPNASIGAKTFYFVGNTETVGDMTADGNIVAGTTTLAELIAMATDKQDVNTPLSATEGLLLTGKTTPITLGTASINQSVTLKRRVARFDIDNDAEISKATILGILVSDANLSGYVFDDNDPAILPTVETGKLKEIAFEGLDKANVGLTPSVFYLYPAAANATTIQLKAKVNGNERLFTVATPDGIQPNKRYTITAKADADMRFELVVADWDEGGGIEGEVISGVTLLSDLADDGDGWDHASLTANARISNTINLVLSTQRSAGMDVVVDENAWGIKVEVDPNYVLTYAAEYQWKAKLTIPEYTKDEAMEIKILFLDKVDPTAPHVKIMVSASEKPVTPPDPTPYLVWAGSNIYWNGNKLTFDDAGETSNEDYQGVYFKWGSLTGISASSSPFLVINYLFGGTVYSPTSAGNGLWSDISTGTSDICAYLAENGQAPGGKKWRLPTSDEFAAIADYSIDGTFESASTSNTHGRTSIDRGYSSAEAEVFFPAAGYRSNGTFSQTGTLTDLGTAGRYWSSDSSGGNGVGMSFTSSEVTKKQSTTKQNAYSVRCVATVTE